MPFSRYVVSFFLSPAMCFSFWVRNSPLWIPDFFRTVFMCVFICMIVFPIMGSYFLSSLGISIMAISPTISKLLLSSSSSFWGRIFLRLSFKVPFCISLVGLI